MSETKVDDDLQTTAYYVASEAIANAVKHSRATRIALHVDARGDDLYVRVEDDGVGGAEQRDGSGLARLADRVGAHGGTLFVSSPHERRHDRGGDPAVRVVIGEDSALFREGLARLLEDAGHDVVAKAADAPSLIQAVDDQLPDLAIVDVRMPPDNTDDGARAARRLRETHPTLGIVLLSQHIETHHSVELVSSGRFGYLLKDRVFDVDEFLDALGRVANGGSALDPEVVSLLLSPLRSTDQLATLTPREREVLAPDGGGPHQPRHRPPALAYRPDRRDTHREHPRQARHRRRRRRPPPRARRTRIPQPPSRASSLKQRRGTAVATSRWASEGVDS